MEPQERQALRTTEYEELAVRTFVSRSQIRVAATSQVTRIHRHGGVDAGIWHRGNNRDFLDRRKGFCCGRFVSRIPIS